MSRNKEINELQKAERRTQILQCALELFATKGLAATKIADISNSTQISQGLVYHYFKSKEEIFSVIIKEAFEKMISAATQLANMKAEPEEKILLAIHGLFEGIRKDSNNVTYYYLLITIAAISEDIPPEAKEVINKNLNRPIEIIREIISVGQAKGTIKKGNPDDMALLFWIIIKGYALSKATQGSKFKLPDIDLIKNIFLVDN